ncbi:hypothetical protein B7486_59790, partial [cyanobacterium TDX16]
MTVPRSDDELPFVDAHEVVVAVAPDVVWLALERYVEADLLANGWPKGWFTFVLGTDPAPGFEEVERREPERMVL